MSSSDDDNVSQNSKQFLTGQEGTSSSFGKNSNRNLKGDDDLTSESLSPAGLQKIDSIENWV